MAAYRAPRQREQTSFWQSFSDLSLGLMSVFALVLLLLLWRQGKLNDELQMQKAAAVEQKAAAVEQKELETKRKEEVEGQRERLVQERRDFSLLLANLLEQTYTIVEGQDEAEAWVQQLFAEGACQLELTKGGELRRRAAGGSAAELYESGEVRITPAAEAALASCQENFLRLAYCLSPGEQGGAGEPAAERLYCRDARHDRAVEQLQRGIEALVLEGDTDRQRVTRTPVPPVQAASGAALALAELGDSFVRNAHLGSERARQALGHLLRLAQEHDQGERDALQVLMSRVRIESPSFGRYQVGPAEWRATGCDPASVECAAARNLSLRLRWKKRELRRPFDEVRKEICRLLSDPTSPFTLGLVAAGKLPADERARFGCADLEGDR